VAALPGALHGGNFSFTCNWGSIIGVGTFTVPCVANPNNSGQTYTEYKAFFLGSFDSAGQVSPTITFTQPPGGIVTCNYFIKGPSTVPGLSQYTYALDLPADQLASTISWTLDKATANFAGPANQVQTVVQFQNTQADFITIRTNFTLNGSGQCAVRHIALVKVDVGKASFTTPGKPSKVEVGTQVFLVKPPPPAGPAPPLKCATPGLINQALNPPPPPGPSWVYVLTPIPTNPNPGKDWDCFTYNGTAQPAEPRKLIKSMTTNGPVAFVAKADVTLTSPVEMPDAQQHIQVGYIQHGYDDGGSASYPQQLTRTLKEPTSITVDWLSSPTGLGANDVWPWYNAAGNTMSGCTSPATTTGSGTGSWKGTLCMSDSPSLSLPAEYNPNDPTDRFMHVHLISARDNFNFLLQMVVRTLDSNLEADTHYFEEARANWSVHFHWPVVPGISNVVSDPDWGTKPPSPTEANVNIVPTIINHNARFRRWRCATASCGP
jgi:hypothetical protein